MTSSQTTLQDENKLSSGIAGLDNILQGGFHKDRLYLIEGTPGAGKTTLSLEFLLEGVQRGEPCLYITLSESKVEVLSVAETHGWSLDGLHIHEVLPSESILQPEEQYTIFHVSDIEMNATTKDILSAIEKVNPARLVLDSLSELQLLASSPLVYRRQLLALKQYLAKRTCTSLFLDDKTGSSGDMQVRSIAHGVICLDRLSTDYGGIRRRLEVAKYRGVAFREGAHDYRILQGGIVVYPRLIASESRESVGYSQLSSGINELDNLLGGGIEEGTSTLIAGPPGTGKSSLTAQFVMASVKRNQTAAMFIFEESASTLLNRADNLNINLREAIAKGSLSLKQVDPAQFTPGEFIQMVCRAADEGAKVIVIDSLNGFLHSMPNEKLLATHLHELLTYLGQRGVITFLVGVQQGMLGANMTTSLDASYLADNVILLRYFEASSEVRQAISVFKKRSGQHERTIRELFITAKGIQIGAALKQFKGILTGVPSLVNESSEKDVSLER